MTKIATGGHPELKMVNPAAAAIDIGSTMHMAAVHPDACDTPVRSFGTFTQDLHDLADWFEACGVTSVAMESTGVNWIPAFEVLEARGFDVILVNARYAKNVPGRKTDVSDAGWLRQLHSYGFLRGCFRPAAEIAIRVGQRRVGRLMRENGIQVIRSRKFKRTTDSDHSFNIAPNLLQQDFTASGPNQKWAGDITYIWTREGWVYLAVIIDLFSRRVVGWAISNRMKQDLALRALNMAIAIRRPPPGCIHHTDRGSQYCAHDYQKLLRKHGFKVSMSGKGNCYDNSAVESFFKSLKAELIWRRNLQTRHEVEIALFEYINGFYNPRRKHSALGWKSPVAFEQRAA